ncbi:MAG: prolyl aminopeptidase [Candidatus Woesearchaeota archaeon]|nr:prolyl aminopeptidase [Candidatus Woesearchaeota archaeon]
MAKLRLFPEIEPYKKGYLKVGGGHRLYYELCGNPEGKPLLVVHGGPGAGCTPKHRREFNPKVWNIILLDQRGAGRSKPVTSIKQNTTWHLVDDIKKLLEKLKIDKIFLRGGSWGSTLSLAYAITYPETVTGMLISGIFLSTKEEMDYFMKGGNSTHFPEAWERFISMVPKKERANADRAYFKRITGRNRKKAREYAFEYAYYEFSLLKMNTTEKEIRKKLKDINYLAFAKIESYYLMNKCFLKENWIIKNAKKIENIPLTIIHGRHDTVTIPKAAYNLHKAIPKSRLFFTQGSHASSEPDTRKRFLKEMKRFEMIIK